MLCNALGARCCSIMEMMVFYCENIYGKYTQKEGNNYRKYIYLCDKRHTNFIMINVHENPDFSTLTTS